MHRTIHQIAILLASMSIATTSCTEKIKFEDITIPIAVNSESSVAPSDFIVTDSQAKVMSGPNGVLFMQKNAENRIEPCKIRADGTVEFAGPTGFSKTEIPSEAGTVNPGFILRVNNPGNEMTLEATLEVGDAEDTITNITIPAGCESLVFFGNGSDLPAPEWADQCVILPEKLKFKANDGFFLKQARLTPSVPKTKATGNDKDNENLTYYIETAYCSPMAYSKGERIHIERSFDDLDIDLSKYTDNIKGKKFSVDVEFTNTMPFDITGKIISSQGMYARLSADSGAIRAGTPENPSRCMYSFEVSKENSDLSTLRQATISADLTAMEGAVLREGMTLTVNIKTVTVTVVEF